jgi:hypothetical protein
LDTCSENVYGTDPNKYNTDGDRLSDGEELNPEEPYPGADPLRKDVYVEVDYKNIDRDKLDEKLKPVRDEFADAPVSNPNGAGNGITLHTVIDEDLGSVVVPRSDEQDSKEQLGNLLMQYSQKPYLYVAADPEKHGKPFKHPQAPAATLLNDGQTIGRTFMHELGHLMGISSQDYEGIDSDEVPFDTYPSVMNYDKARQKRDYTGYNDGAPYDDWEAIQCHFDIYCTV